MTRVLPSREIVVGVLVVALSGAGLALVEVMRPPNREEQSVLGRAVRDHALDGVISLEERDRRIEALDLGVFGGWVVTRRAYRNYRVLALGGVFMGLMLVAAGTRRSSRLRRLATPPGS